ncbi:hypothetical protein K470DRAFT_285174 [Piedraia hortae CBS 480.64]|uniref:Band 7 domain-containing protein n=1 Tax=Piedraia hortae CBS 480.64 TaxID=1314780 RepID=A0A6A7C2B9_9PEZI|nr:hypothetical protein K470DRAFT_285174 [Piedraia hortae CBS 480.64]
MDTEATTSTTNDKASQTNYDGPQPLVNVAPPRQEGLQPSYARIIQPNEKEEEQHRWYGAIIDTVGNIIGILGVISGCICFPYSYRGGNMGLVSKFARFSRVVDPGLVKVNTLSEKIFQIDVKIKIAEVPRQVRMTKDDINLTLMSVIYYHITSPHKAAFGISDIRISLVERTQTTLHHVIGACMLQNVIERRGDIAQSIKVESMLIKDIIFSQDLQDSLSMAAQSKRTGEAKVISARAEAADILSSAPAMQIRYFEAMQTMERSANNKVIFLPAPNQTMNNALDVAEKNGEDP